MVFLPHKIPDLGLSSFCSQCVELCILYIPITSSGLVDSPLSDEECKFVYNLAVKSLVMTSGFHGCCFMSHGRNCSACFDRHLWCLHILCFSHHHVVGNRRKARPVVSSDSTVEMPGREWDDKLDG